MIPTSSDLINFNPVNCREFRPLSAARNPHLQTVLPRLIRRRLRLQPHWQRLTLPDKDFIDLAWSEPPSQAYHKPRVVLFHGLEGSFFSPYAHGLLQTFRAQGWLGVVMHFRGCSGEPNRMERIYHSGETGDASYFLHWLRAEWGKVPTAAVGVSLGGNMLACLLAQQGENRLLDAAVMVSAPLMLEPCSHRLERGFSRLYQRYLLGLLKQNASRKLLAWPGTLPVSRHRLKQMRTLREFDNEITAPIHGFQDAGDYYRRCSALPLLAQIRTPALIIHAGDDPFMTPEVIPDRQQLPPGVEYQLTRYGGHVGFVGGTLRRPQMWLEQRIPQWLIPWLEQK